MDASADDPQRFRIRRSPSIGSSAPPVAAAARAGKRKLSTAAFGSSPNMGPHPPSSPITSEHPTDGMHSVSQVAGTSRSTIDNADAGRPAAGSDKPPNSVHATPSAHTQFSDWQDQRRCHSVLADFDYSPPAEDRRDPRSSNARIVMPVPSNHPQVMVASAAHDLPSTESVSQHAALQQPPIASGGSQQADRDVRASSSRMQQTEQAAGLRSAQLQSSLSQTSLSMPPSPDRGMSPSPCFSAFDYQAPPAPTSQRLPSSALAPPCHHLEQTRAGSVSQASASTCGGVSKPDGASHVPFGMSASNLAGSAAASGASVRPWLGSSLLKPSEPKHREASSTAAGIQTISASDTASSQRAFQLQPVPSSKRRRVEDASTCPVLPKHHDLHTKDETRRCSDAGLPFHPPQNLALPQKTALPTGSNASRPVQSPSSVTSLKYAPLRAPSASSAAPSATRALTSSLHVNAAVAETSPTANQAAGSGLSGKHRSTHLGNVAASPSMAPPRKPHSTFSRKMSRLVRAQSVPNLRAKATLDVAAPSHHRLVLPSHWASYVSSHARQGREGVPSAVKGGNTRSSKGFPFNVAHYPVGSSSSRSRSTFTPTLHPPITRHTLRELDLFEILKNPQLRHDVVFDPNVQFRPNFDGERGRRKREAGERYWTAVVREIETGCTCTAFSRGQLLPCTCKAKDRLRQNATAGTMDVCTPLQQSRIPSRIPLLVQELRTICLSILPSNYPADAVAVGNEVAAPAAAAEEHKADDVRTSDEATSTLRQKVVETTSWASTHHELIAQTLDPNLISQELQHGVLDVPALITFMGSILKLHCAPMRDEAIERMVEVVCVDRNIGKGLRLCFEILELMKLDIANHQLRSARPFLVETAVDFEIRWFKEQIEQGKMSLEKTTTWIRQALASCNADERAPRGSDTVIKAFSQGMLQLIFDVPGSPPLVSPVATPLGSPSSSSLNNTFASHYPETFQFDAYRMMTFHNDVSDLTIVYMLVLLFRQLCSTPLDDGGALPASVASIVQNQLKGIKGEIWCLVNDANLCLSNASALPLTPMTPKSASSPTRRTAGLDGKLFLGSAGGFAKLDHPRWRQSMQNVLLQVAARAAAVQAAARAGSCDPSTVKTVAPSAATQKLLNSWMDTNLRSGSALHKICQSRLRDVVLGMLYDKVRNGLRPSSTSVVACAPVVGASDTGNELDRNQHKRPVPIEPQAEIGIIPTPCKRLKGDVPAAAAASPLSPSPSPSPSPEIPAVASAAAPWDAAMSRAGLDPFAAEIRLLSDRIAKVATFHLRVFHHLYQGIESGRHKTRGGAQ